jgi:uncharacterized protein YndB with AHSA1/START domain
MPDPTTLRPPMTRNSETFKVSTPNERQIVMTRRFDAPRHLVFEAYTTPELLQRWLVPPGWTFPVCEVDLRVGGKYRFVWRSAQGQDMGMGGVYREIVRPERIVTTEKFDDAWYPGEALGTLILAEHDGRTTLTLTVEYESREARDVALKSGMETGVAAGYDKLETLLADRAV